MQSYNIHFIRHGLTEGNIKGQYIGVTDIPVCEQGIENLKKLKQKYEYPKVDICYSSPLRRCIETCNIIYPDKKPIVINDLRECDFGDWEGKTTEELSDNPKFISWIRNNRMEAPPHGESHINFQQRICTALENIVNDVITKGITSIGIFAHGGVIFTLMVMFSIEKFEMADLMADNGCGYSVRITPSIWTRDKFFEIYDRIPQNYSGKISGNFEKMIRYSENIFKGK